MGGNILEEANEKGHTKSCCCDSTRELWEGEHLQLQAVQKELDSKKTEVENLMLTIRQLKSNHDTGLEKFREVPSASSEGEEQGASGGGGSRGVEGECGGSGGGLLSDGKSEEVQSCSGHCAGRQDMGCNGGIGGGGVGVEAEMQVLRSQICVLQERNRMAENKFTTGIILCEPECHCQCR